MQPRKTALQVFSPSATLEGAIANQWTQSFSSEKCSNAASQLHESAPPRRSISLYGKFASISEWPSFSSSSRANPSSGKSNNK